MFKRILHIVAVASLTMVGSGCGKTIEFGGTCNVAEDQKGTFMASLELPPVRAIADSRFAQIPGAMADIQAAVDEWNKKGQVYAKRDMFRLLQGSVPTHIRQMDPRPCNSRFGSETQFFIVREENKDRWAELGLAKNVPGVTMGCFAGGKIKQQIIYINPTLIDRRQLRTVILHELGHALGLDHSCKEGGGSGDFIGCSKLKPNHAYVQAAMFPYITVSQTHLSTSAIEIKDLLKDNDTTRAECLYSPK